MEQRVLEFAGATIDLIFYELLAAGLIAGLILRRQRGDSFDGSDVIFGILTLALLGVLIRRVVFEDARLLELRLGSGWVGTSSWAHFVWAAGFLCISAQLIRDELTPIGRTLGGVVSFFALLRVTMIIIRRVRE